MQVVYRGYVNAWDCDELGHMNVQFYVGKASEAFEGLLSDAGLAREARAQVRIARHRIRFLNEMHVSDLVEIAGGVTAVANDRLEAVLEVRNGLGKPCARFDVEARHAELIAPSLVAVEPLTGGLQQGDEGEGTIKTAAGFRETIRNIVTPAQCDADGRLAPRGVMARFSEAQGHLWAMLDAPRAWQRSSDLATATLDYTIRYGERPPAGGQVKLMTKVTAASAKTIRFRHWLFDAETGAMAAAAAGAALFIDKASRKAVTLPDRVAEAAARLIAG